ncbi:UDP-3-O-(3-hydroxymyristoyl)glucosamine N-acyltransferase [uncultured Victivallis sp.]|uniref:UDP-3-O-(3-hydroxymyristoyl)glucosamine N-acyltransferase n=1 Tax=Victivallis sp. TaxID=2049020 RepID=UPI0025FF2273|nr:UDP-3-O-(3-hydroxymyristoyl)glucosamine N-acyltransferase [uncultured Victivallis sp.]
MNHVTLTAAKIAEMVNGKLIGSPDRTISSVSGIRDAQSDQLSFIGNKKYQHQLESTKAGVVLVCPDLADAPAVDRTLIVCDNVDYAFAKVIAVFAEEPPKWPVGVHPSAVVSPDAKLGQGVSINANAVIEAGAEIGDGTVIGAGCYIGHDVKIGAGSLLYPNVTVMYRCVIGRKAVIHPGVVIGGDGFGFIPTKQGLVKVPQTGIVQIDDDVEIGANTTIDRARFGKTWIKSNVKIDNQVMVAHNVVIGESSILVAQCGIAGSAELGRGVVLAAKSGVNGHITLGDGVQVAGTSGVVKSLPAGAIALGTPAESQREFMARHTLPSRFEKLSAKVEALRKEIAELKASK